MAKRKNISLPRRIYVTHETDGSSEPYLVADKDTALIDDGETVGIYELKETRTMHVSRDLT